MTLSCTKRPYLQQRLYGSVLGNCHSEPQRLKACLRHPAGNLHICCTVSHYDTELPTHSMDSIKEELHL